MSRVLNPRPDGLQRSVASPAFENPPVQQNFSVPRERTGLLGPVYGWNGLNLQAQCTPGPSQPAPMPGSFQLPANDRF